MEITDLLPALFLIIIVLVALMVMQPKTCVRMENRCYYLFVGKGVMKFYVDCADTNAKYIEQQCAEWKDIGK